MPDVKKQMLFINNVLGVARNLKQKILRDLIEAVLVFFIIFILVLTNQFNAFDYILRDRLYQIPRGVSSAIKIIAIAIIIPATFLIMVISSIN